MSDPTVTPPPTKAATTQKQDILEIDFDPSQLTPENIKEVGAFVVVI